MPDIKTLLIAAVAGIACVLAVAAAQSVGVGAVPLLLLAPLPIYFAALAYGTAAALGSSIFAIIVAATALSPQAATFLGLAFTIPASIIGHQANLAQQNDDGTMDWYPLPMLFFNLSVLLAIGIVLIGAFIGFDAELMLPRTIEAVTQIFAANPPPTPLSDADIKLLAERVLRMLPFLFGSMWLVVHVVNAYLAAMICRALSLLPRPKDDIPASIKMPIAGLAIMLISLLGAVFMSGTIQMVCAVFAGIFVTGFALVGIAAIHLRARNNSSSFVFLLLSYAIILFFYFPLFLYAIGGVSRTLNLSKNTPPSAGNDNT